MRTLLRSSLPLVISALVACAGNTAATNTDTPGDDSGRTRLTAENRSSVNMDIYARRPDGQESRVGYAPAGETVTFQLPAGLLTGALALHFVARPVRGEGEAIISELFNVKPGEEVVWSIPPQ
jgi:hypothetical protein